MMAQEPLFDLVIQDDVLDVELIPVDDESDIASASAMELGSLDSSTPALLLGEDEDDESCFTMIDSSQLPDNDQCWLIATDAAKALGISTRRLRKLAALGKVARRRQEGRFVYQVPGLGAQLSSEVENTNSGRMSAYDPQTQPGSSIAAKCSPSKRESSIHDEKTVIVSAEEIEYVENDFVPTELMHTNRELMHLIDVVLGNWTAVSSQRTVSAAEIRRALSYSLELQHCLGEWKQYSQNLERRHMESAHTASRALDIAEEVLSSRWASSRRRQTLRDRVNELRARL
ncbi:MAG: hypothetical protein RBU37_14995 [Myxococcota bacterium]|nr:hypothetical protein [Myxococcota bacterium]